MFILKILGKLIKALKSGESPSQMGWGFSFGTMLGFIPGNTLFTVIIFFILFIFKVNFASAMLAFAIYSLIAYLLDPFFHQIGFIVLTQISFLKPFWTTLYNLPIAPLSRFNNTVVMGSLICSIILFIPHYLFFRRFVINYRETWNTQIAKWKIVKMLKGSNLVQMYTKIKTIGG